MNKTRYVSAWVNESHEFYVLDLEERKMVGDSFCSVEVAKRTAKYLNSPDTAAEDLSNLLTTIEAAFGYDGMIAMYSDYISSRVKDVANRKVPELTA